MWWTGGALGFDLETDGKDPLDARIITSGRVALVAGSGPMEREVMLKPERDIPAGATAVHHITTERAREEGVDREVGILSIAEDIANLAGEHRPLVGHNVPFDLTILDREMRRVGIGRLKTSPDGSGWVRMVVGDDVADFPVIDTYVLDKAVDRYRPGKRQLSFVAAHYGVPMAEGAAHGATADVIACLRIAITIANRCRMANGDAPDGYDMDLCNQVMAMYSDRKHPNEIGRTLATVGRYDLAELHAAQVEWAAEQAVGLREHFLKKGDKEAAATVDGTWPFRPVPFMETIKTELV